MPLRDGPVTRMETLSVEDRRKECRRFQEHWYKLIAPRFAGKTVLDVGAGTGYGLDVLRAAGAQAEGVDPLPLRGDITAKRLEDFADKSFDAITCVDVIEHVDDDAAFFAHLLRVARQHVFISTPNWNVSRCVNGYHFREYTPEELKTLLAGLKYEQFTSDARCCVSVISDLSVASNNFGVLISVPAHK